MAPRSGEAMADPQWARLQSDVNCRLRRGAWYRVADLTSADAMLDVNREQVPVPRTSLKIVSSPPHAAERRTADHALCPLRAHVPRRVGGVVRRSGVSGGSIPVRQSHPLGT